MEIRQFVWLRKKVHWSDCDAAGVAWFPRFLGWFEDAEEELYAVALGRTRQAILEGEGFGMPRVEVSTKYRSPVRAGQVVRVGIASTIENPRRVRQDFAMRDEASGRLVAEGFVRVACVAMPGFAPRDLPDSVRTMVDRLPDLAARQARGETELPWV
jgi:acyl-CoA thioesterase FadM